MLFAIPNTCWNLSLHTSSKEREPNQKKGKIKQNLDSDCWYLSTLNATYKQNSICCFSEPFLWRLLTPRFCNFSIKFGVSKPQDACPSEEDITHTVERFLLNSCTCSTEPKGDATTGSKAALVPCEAKVKLLRKHRPPLQLREAGESQHCC